MQTTISIIQLCPVEPTILQEPDCLYCTSCLNSAPLRLLTADCQGPELRIQKRVIWPGQLTHQAQLDISKSPPACMYSKHNGNSTTPLAPHPAQRHDHVYQQDEKEYRNLHNSLNGILSGSSPGFIKEEQGSVFGPVMLSLDMFNELESVPWLEKRSKIGGIRFPVLERIV